MLEGHANPGFIGNIGNDRRGNIFITNYVQIVQLGLYEILSQTS